MPKNQPNRDQRSFFQRVTMTCIGTRNQRIRLRMKGYAMVNNSSNLNNLCFDTRIITFPSKEKGEFDQPNSLDLSLPSKDLFATTKTGTIKEYKKLLYKKQYTHLKVSQLRYSGRDSIIQVRIDLIFIMVPLGEQKQNGGGTDT